MKLIGRDPLERKFDRDADSYWHAPSFELIDDDEVWDFDEDDELIRSMIHSDIADIGDRRIPRRVQVIPADKPDELTEVFYEELTFDVDIPDRTFSLQSLRR